MSTTLELTPLALRQGIWEGRIVATDKATPAVEVLHLDKPVADAEVKATDDPNTWHLTVPVPPDAISDGVQTFLIVDKAANEAIGNFAVIAGEALGDDLRAEVDLLRAELDMLKRAFRRHCVETM